jgi:16S rRNA (uracil1498-N3)-methyltransferase
MSGNERTAQRLFLEAPLAAGERVACTPEQANYLLNVLRLGRNDEVLVFNGRDGEWRARLADVGKRRCALECVQLTRAQTKAPDLHYLFAPLKHARLDYMVQKATEMGASRLQPVLTRHTIAARVNGERMRANVIEAAEQCGILNVPEVAAPERLETLLHNWDERRALVFCDEAAEIANPLAALGRLEGRPIAVLVGPEGGFEASEQSALRAKPFAVPISLGPRIMRADTAAVAALALINAATGDWC